MDTLEKLVEEGVVVIRDYYEDRIVTDLNTGERKEERVFHKKYYDTRKFIKTFNPVIDKLVKDFEGNPKAQSIFILMSILEDNKEVMDVNLGYAEFSKILNKHEVKKWTRAQLSNCLKWLVDKGYISKLLVGGSVFRINYKYLYNGSITNALGLNTLIEQNEVINNETLSFNPKLQIRS